MADLKTSSSRFYTIDELNAPYAVKRQNFIDSVNNIESFCKTLRYPNNIKCTELFDKLVDAIDLFIASGLES
jgi:hypothetical protein